MKRRRTFSDEILLIFTDASDPSASATLHVWAVQEGRDANSTSVHLKSDSLMIQWDVQVAHSHEAAHQFKK